MDSSMSILSALSVSVTSLVFACILVSFLRRRPHYPPGPPGFPIVGNLLEMPRAYAWRSYRDEGRRHGSDIVHYETLGSHLVVLNTIAAAQDLLDRRSNIYSDRPTTVMLHDLTGWGRINALMEYGDEWRFQRKLYHEHLHPSATSQYHAKHAKAARRAVRLLLETPERFAAHLRYITAAVILDVVYALDIQPDDETISVIEAALRALADIMVEVWMVDLFPFLKYIPSWFPGAGFKRRAAEWKCMVNDMFDVPYRKFKESTVGNVIKPCFAASLISSMDSDVDSAIQDKAFKIVTATTVSGGSDTVTGTLVTFVLAMVMFPESQAAAHAELDRVLGRERVPEIVDRELLPYITALFYEVTRWHPSGPIGLPHRLRVDDEYHGYHIPAGAVVIANIWAMLHDETIFADPGRFMPERFLNTDGTLNNDAPRPDALWGFGRRVCPGRQFATDFLWIAMAHILAVFKIEPIVDVDGQSDKPEARFSPYHISLPAPFKCQFKHRYPGAENLVSSVYPDD